MGGSEYAGYIIQRELRNLPLFLRAFRLFTGRPLMKFTRTKVVPATKRISRNVAARVAVGCVRRGGVDAGVETVTLRQPIRAILALKVAFDVR